MRWLSSLLGVLVAVLGLLAQGRTVLASETPPSVGPIPMAVGLAGINDWSVQQPFLDVMKTARPWIGHKPHQWGGLEHEDLAQAGLLDDAGWPVSIPRTLGSIGTVILTDLPEQATSTAGRYRLRFRGKGIVEVSGRASKVRYGKNEVTFDYSPGPGLVDIRIQRSDRAGTGDYVRAITVVKLDHAQAFDAGAIFTPDWLARMRGFSALRFMDWMATNNSTQREWGRRPQVQDYTWARQGVPLEIMLALLVEIAIDGWFNMPHLANDDYVRSFAALVHERLPPDRRVYVEYSNEVWNWQFRQASWADEQALARWNQKDTWVQFYGMRAAEVARIWSDTFGTEDAAQLVNVISSQTGWLGLEEMVMNAPAWMSEAPGNPRPADAFDAYAVTGYFGGILGTEARAPVVRQWITDSRTAAETTATTQGLTGAEFDAYVTQHQYDDASAKAGQELHNGSLSGDETDIMAGLLGKKG